MIQQDLLVLEYVTWFKHWQEYTLELYLRLGNVESLRMASKT